MVLSRAQTQSGVGAVLMPLLDLLNHGDSCRHVNHRDRDTVVAARNLSAGEEITFIYVASPSKARLLTSFGFMQGAPSASLLAAGLPARDPSFLRQHGCAGAERTDLWVGDDGAMSERGVRDALKC